MSLAREITITIAGELIALRPSLRHAMCLESREGSFAQLIRDVTDGSLTAALEIIRPNHPIPLLDAKIMDAGLDNLRAPLLLYVAACAGIDEELSDDAEAPGKPVSFEEHLTGLYRIATGWLGWPPHVALDATPTEIIEAHKGRLAMLKAIFGGANDEEQVPVDMTERFKTVLQSFGTTKLSREGAVS